MRETKKYVNNFPFPGKMQDLGLLKISCGVIFFLFLAPAGV